MTVFLSEADAARLGIDGAKPRRSAKHAREARPDIPRAPRAASGDGDRVKDLMALAARGWTCYHSNVLEHWMTGKAGVSRRYASYREMLDTLMCKK